MEIEPFAGSETWLRAGLGIDWIETYWNGSLEGVVFRKLYRGEITSVQWNERFPVIIVEKMCRFHLENQKWSLQDGSKVFDFQSLRSLNIKFGTHFLLNAQMLRFNIAFNITALIGAVGDQNTAHFFANACDEQEWIKQIQKLFAYTSGSP